MTRRLVLSYVIVTVLVLVGLGVTLEVVYTERERERVFAAAAQDAGVLATLYEDALEEGEPIEDRPAESYRQRTGSGVVVVDAEGRSVVDTERAPGRSQAARPEIAAALNGRTVTGRLRDDARGELLYAAVPVASGGTVYGAVRITQDPSDLDARIRRSRIALAALAAVVLALVALLGWALAHSVTRPIRRLNAMATRFAAGDLDAETESVGGPPEVRALGDTMTRMAARLGDLLRRQRTFVADASHQLRTPLAALRLKLENLHAKLPPERTGELDAAIEETNRLGDLVADLLQLTRSDEQRAVGSADLTAVAMTRIDTWSALAESSGVRLAADLPQEPIMARAAPEAVEQILDNLLENAFHASGAGATVTVRVTRTADRCTLAVRDEGPGLSDEEKRAATQRFWRGRASHTGTGLGLSIVESLAVASGATLHLDDAPGGGLAVTVAFLPVSTVH